MILHFMLRVNQYSSKCLIFLNWRFNYLFESLFNEVQDYSNRIWFACIGRVLYSFYTTFTLGSNQSFVFN